MKEHEIIGGEGISEYLVMEDKESVAIAEEFLYEGDIMMLAADPGTGKSVVALQMVINLTSGTRLFGVLDVPKPRTVCYMQLEGTRSQVKERLNAMRSVNGFNPERMIWDYVNFINVLDPTSVKKCVNDLKEVQEKIDVIIFDPIYKTVVGGLAKEEPAKAIIKFTDIIRAEFGAAIVMIHHTHKDRFSNKDGKRIEEDDPFFGSQWLKAHIDTGYHLKRIPNSNTRSCLRLTKDRNSRVTHYMPLSFDAETFTLHGEVSKDGLTAYERVLGHLSTVHKFGKKTDFNQIITECSMSRSLLRKIQKKLLERKIIRCDKRDGHKKVWEVIKDPTKYA